MSTDSRRREFYTNAGEPTVHDLRALQFSSEGKVHFKLSGSVITNTDIRQEPYREELEREVKKVSFLSIMFAL